MTQVVDQAGRLAVVAPAELPERVIGLVLSLLEAVSDVAVDVVEQLVIVLAEVIVATVNGIRRALFDEIEIPLISGIPCAAGCFMRTSTIRRTG